MGWGDRTIHGFRILEFKVRVLHHQVEAEERIAEAAYAAVHTGPTRLEARDLGGL